MHVQHADGEAKFWIEPAVELHANYGLNRRGSQRLRDSLRSTSMKSAALGRRTSPVEVTNVSPHGFWLFIGEKEQFVSFAEFPWFKDASIREISRVELPSAHHLRKGKAP